MGGGLLPRLPRKVEKRIRMPRQFGACFTVYGNPELIETYGGRNWWPREPMVWPLATKI
jgi:hypothetical protein